MYLNTIQKIGLMMVILFLSLGQVATQAQGVFEFYPNGLVTEFEKDNYGWDTIYLSGRLNAIMYDNVGNQWVTAEVSDGSVNIVDTPSISPIHSIYTNSNTVMRFVRNSKLTGGVGIVAFTRAFMIPGEPIMAYRMELDSNNHWSTTSGPLSMPGNYNPLVTVHKTPSDSLEQVILHGNDSVGATVFSQIIDTSQGVPLWIPFVEWNYNTGFFEEFDGDVVQYIAFNKTYKKPPIRTPLLRGFFISKLF